MAPVVAAALREVDKLGEDASEVSGQAVLFQHERIFSSAENRHLVARRMFLTVFSALRGGCLLLRYNIVSRLGATMSREQSLLQSAQYVQPILTATRHTYRYALRPQSLDRARYDHSCLDTAMAQALSTRRLVFDQGP